MSSIPTTEEAVAAARQAGLLHVDDSGPGIRRQRRGGGFVYLDPEGRRITEKPELERIRHLAIPPAWTDVWICPSDRGHIQATGRDARRRKQYRYHERWREVRDASKYEHTIAFARALPRIRRRVTRDMARAGLPREKVVACTVRLLETTLIRIGNDEYARQNQHYGLTTLRDEHAQIRGAQVRFVFRGKSGVDQSVAITDRRLARVLRSCQELPGQRLLEYVGADGAIHAVHSHDVNEYLHRAGGREYTAKDFRTWAGTVLAAHALCEFERFDSQAQAKRNLLHAIDTVAARLGNTRAVSRRSYVHPAIVDSYLDGTLAQLLGARAETELSRDLHRLSPEEAAVLAVLQQRLSREGRRRRRAA
ncbi:MAG TPA: DNA topoisomerase IB [Candidatus Dormibacteraeota bacterium]|nr:DNA topoisomerase IB [Candidatus Dormibacteraeota bacterium]